MYDFDASVAMGPFVGSESQPNYVHFLLKSFCKVCDLDASVAMGPFVGSESRPNEMK